MPRSGTTRLAALAAVTTLAVATPLTGASGTSGPPRPRAHGHGPLLPRAAHGEDAIARLGPRLADAARVNHRSAAALERLLRRDHTAWLDRHGALYYVDPAVQRSSSSAASAPAAAHPYDQTFLLHSKPWVGRKIYLDFDGATVSGTEWNEEGLPAGTYAGYDSDGDPASFSTGEMDTVQDVWARVSEDYAGVDVDVTTQDPGDAGLQRTSSEDTTYGVRTMFTEDDEVRLATCGGCSGVAYLDDFDEIVDTARPWAHQPAFVFSNDIGDDPGDLADVVSHEVGHTVGLEHDGDAGGEYSDGFGAWSPIMGAGYKQLTQFSAGEYAGATNTQQDFTVMAGHGLVRSTDDHGGTIATATALPDGTTTGAPGTLTDRSDKDVFAIPHPCASTLKVDVVPAALGPDLDVNLRVLRADGSVVTTVNPPIGTGTGAFPGQDAHATLSSLSAGTYYAEVDGVAFDDGTTSFSDYGNIGRYTLTATGCGGTAPVVPSRPTDLVVDDSPSLGASDLRWQPPATDGGAPVTSYVVSRTGVSPVTLPATARTYRFTGLSPRTAYTFSVTAVTDAGSAVATLAHTTARRQIDAPGSLSVSRSGLPSGWVALRWTRPATYGNTLVEYRYTVLEPGQTSGGSYGYVDGDQTTGYEAGLVLGHTYTATLWAVDDAGNPGRRATRTFTYGSTAHVPSAPTIGTASSGTAGGTRTALARWYGSSSNGGAAITSYKVTAFRYDTSGHIVGRYAASATPTARSKAMVLPSGRYRFVVQAVNSVGLSAGSAKSNLVYAR